MNDTCRACLCQVKAKLSSYSQRLKKYNIELHDIIQDALIEWQKWRKIDISEISEENVPEIVKIAKRNIFKKIKKAMKFVSTDSSINTFSESEGFENHNFEPCFHSGIEEELDLNYILDLLNEKERHIIELHNDNGFNYKEIAEKLYCTEHSIQQAVYRIKEKLKKNGIPSPCNRNSKNNKKRK